MFKNKKFYTLSFLLFLILPLFGIQCTRGISEEAQRAAQPVVLNWWAPFIDTSSVKPIIEAYRAIHPNVTINFRKIRYEDYEREVLNALAEDRGPDILSLQNTWLSGWQTKLLPMPSALTLSFQEVRGPSIKQEVVWVLRSVPTLGIRGAQNNFVEAVAKDVILPTGEAGGAQAVYGLPLALDTIALYYNRDMLNLAGIPSPPKTWTEFQSIVGRLNKFDQTGAIIQSGAALGTARNTERAFDILSLLMMQNGTVMMDERGQPVFDRLPPALKDRGLPPGEEALVFYTDFANPAQSSYSWHEGMPNSLQAFAASKTAFFFGYSYHLPVLKNIAQKLNFAISSMPQIEGNPEVNFANYWVETVSRKTKNPNFAWDFIQFAASSLDRQTGRYWAESYLSDAKKPTALRTLVVKQSEDLNIGVFVSQTLTAKSWYKGKDAKAAEEAFLEMIEAVNRGQVKPRDAIRTAVRKVEQTLK